MHSCLSGAMDACPGAETFVMQCSRRLTPAGMCSYCIAEWTGSDDLVSRGTVRCTAEHEWRPCCAFSNMRLAWWSCGMQNGKMMGIAGVSWNCLLWFSVWLSWLSHCA